MNKQEIFVRLSESKYIYGYMYGKPFKWVKTRDGRNVATKDTIIEIAVKELRIWSEGFCYVWGWPGPDYNLYRFEEYGKTWAFTKEELEEIDD